MVDDSFFTRGGKDFSAERRSAAVEYFLKCITYGWAHVVLIPRIPGHAKDPLKRWRVHVGQQEILRVPDPCCGQFAIALLTWPECDALPPPFWLTIVSPASTDPAGHHRLLFLFGIVLRRYDGFQAE